MGEHWVLLTVEIVALVIAFLVAANRLEFFDEVFICVRPQTQLGLQLLQLLQLLVDFLNIELRFAHELDHSILLWVIDHEVDLLLTKQREFDGLLEQAIPALVFDHCSFAPVSDLLYRIKFLPFSHRWINLEQSKQNKKVLN